MVIQRTLVLAAVPQEHQSLKCCAVNVCLEGLHDMFAVDHTGLDSLTQLSLVRVLSVSTSRCILYGALTRHAQRHRSDPPAASPYALRTGGGRVYCFCRIMFGSSGDRHKCFSLPSFILFLPLFQVFFTLATSCPWYFFIADRF